MEKVVHIFHSFADAERAEIEYYRALTPEKRMEILFDLIANAHGDEIEQRSERVYRIVKLGEC